MVRFAQIACATTAIVAAASLPVHADPISISVVSGSVVINRAPDNGTLDLAGTHGFTLTAGVAPEAGIQGPFAQCLVPACTPGTPISLDISFTGQSDLLQDIVMTVNGDTFDDFEGANATGNLVMSFTGTVVAPTAGPLQISVSAPFSFTGTASGPNLDALLHGSGSATLTLVPFQTPSSPPSWSASELRFEFSQPTPEPSTLVLLGSGGLALFRRRQPRKPQA